MKTTVTVSLRDEVIKVVYALMEYQHMKRSEAVDYLCWQGVLKMKEEREREARK